MDTFEFKYFHSFYYQPPTSSPVLILDDCVKETVVTARAITRIFHHHGEVVTLVKGLIDHEVSKIRCVRGGHQKCFQSFAFKPLKEFVPHYLWWKFLSVEQCLRMVRISEVCFLYI